MVIFIRTRKKDDWFYNGFFKKQYIQMQIKMCRSCRSHKGKKVQRIQKVILVLQVFSPGFALCSDPSCPQPPGHRSRERLPAASPHCLGNKKLISGKENLRGRKLPLFFSYFTPPSPRLFSLLIPGHLPGLQQKPKHKQKRGPLCSEGECLHPGFEWEEGAPENSLRVTAQTVSALANTTKSLASWSLCSIWEESKNVNK